MRYLLLLLLLIAMTVQAKAADFDFYRQSGEKPGPTLLVIGGIDGDEPGGFHAAATLLTHYQVSRGHLWIVPNLNFADIIKRRRGRMNLKFASLADGDPYYQEVSSIKQIITNPQVDLVLNLHDGSGFYHPTRIDSRRNPGRWGQSCVIDQALVPKSSYAQLQPLVENVIADINRDVPANDQIFRLKNVETAKAAKDVAARKSLSFFAVRNNKAAVAVEASKDHPVHLRVYYHLLALESFMERMKIDFSRDFPLTPEGVRQAIRDDALVSLAEGRIQLELNNMRPELKNFPVATTPDADFSAFNPLITLQQDGERYRIHYGNNRLAFLRPRYYPLDTSINAISMTVDGREQQIPFGSIIPVSKSFSINSDSGYKTNVVGFSRPGRSDDGRTAIHHSQLSKKFSIDKAGKIYRVEVYRGERFSGMVLIDFRPRSTKKEPLVIQTAQKHSIKIERHN